MTSNALAVFGLLATFTVPQLYVPRFGTVVKPRVLIPDKELTLHVTVIAPAVAAYATQVFA